MTLIHTKFVSTLRKPALILTFQSFLPQGRLCREPPPVRSVPHRTPPPEVRPLTGFIWGQDSGSSWDPGQAGLTLLRPSLSRASPGVPQQTAPSPSAYTGFRRQAPWDRRNAARRHTARRASNPPQFLFLPRLPPLPIGFPPCVRAPGARISMGSQCRPPPPAQLQGRGFPFSPFRTPPSFTFLLIDDPARFDSFSLALTEKPVAFPEAGFPLSGSLPCGQFSTRLAIS